VYNIKLIIAYDGYDFLGWQETAMGPSIEGSLRAILEQILQEKIVLQAASRTDAGVHAEGQIVQFFTKKENIHLSRLKHSLNRQLPPTIRILHLEKMELSFHPTLDARGKEYHYQVFNGEILPPKLRSYAWHIFEKLDIEKMQQALPFFLGSHDFSSFCNQRRGIENIDKTTEIFHISIQPFSTGIIQIIIAGNKFLFKMVRNIVGTLVFVGKGKISPHDIDFLIKKKERASAGMTAPAHGLTLMHVFYKNPL
jgi:tRNA pseudouridine38-40 synthase